MEPPPASGGSKAFGLRGLYPVQTTCFVGGLAKNLFCLFRLWMKIVRAYQIHLRVSSSLVAFQIEVAWPSWP